MRGATVPRQAVHSAEINGQRTRPGKSLQERRASSYTHSLWGKLHEPHGPFLLGLRIHFAVAVSSFFSCFSSFAWTLSLVSYPSMLKQERPEKFPNNVTFGEG